MLSNTKLKVKVDFPYGKLQPVVDWCERNCIGDWRYTEDHDGRTFFGWIFIFDNERDYVAFTLFNK